MKLYVKGIIREPNDTLYTFLCKVLRLNGEYWNQSTTNATYLDSEFTELQCISGKQRSFDDLLLISKTYFKVPDKSVAKAIKKILDKNKDFIFILCDNIDKWVLNRQLSKSEIFKYCGSYKKSDEKTNNPGIGTYSFDNIITLMGLTKEDVKIK